MPVSIEERLSSLPGLSRDALHQLWKELFEGHSALHLRRELMISILGYRLQEQRFGSLSARCRLRLAQQARAFEMNSKVTSSRQPNLGPGTRLVRQWNNQVHLVNVESSGFEYQGARYQSLSQIARLITGTRWSGPLFFGVKSMQSANGSRTTK